jgi:hypothetical protein
VGEGRRESHLVDPAFACITYHFACFASVVGGSKCKVGSVCLTACLPAALFSRLLRSLFVGHALAGLVEHGPQHL